MKLNIVYGRSGSGKSEYIYEQIGAIAENEKVFVIVPEQCNLSVEKKLFDLLKKDCLMNIEVLTLSRMAYRIANEVGAVKPQLSKAGKDMLIFDLLNKEKFNLKFLGKSEKNVDIVNRLITELKKHSVSIEDLKNAEITNEYTCLKLNDIILLYDEYDQKICSKFIDENDSLDILADNLDKSNLIKDSYIFIDEFLGFTKQEYNVFEKILSQAKEVTVTTLADNLNDKTNKENDIFYFNKKYANNLKKIATSLGIKTEDVYLRDVYRFKNDELKMLEESFSNSNAKKMENKTKNISLFVANNPYTEVEYIAKNIHNLVKKCGYSYNEIGIITEDLSLYSEDAKAVFTKYDIPIFIDEKKELNQNILIKFIISMLDIFVKNWSFDSIFNYLKIGLLDIDEEDIYLLENYCRKWGIRGNKFYNKKFEYEQLNDVQEKLESLRQKIVTPLLKFKDSVSQNKNAIQITKELYNFLIDNKINIILDEKIKSYNSLEISDEYNTSYKLLISVLEDITTIFGNDKMTFERYKDLLEVGLNSCELGKIPATQDQVVLGDTERTRSNKLKVLFVLGINDGMFPKANRVEGFLNDNDRDYLLEVGIELAKNSVDSLFEEHLNIYRTLTTPEEKLYLSYSSSNKEGKAVRPSILIKKIKRIFPNISEDTDVIENFYSITSEKATFDDALNLYKEFLDGKDMPKEWQDILRYYYKNRRSSFKKAISGIFYTNKSQQISDENIKKLYGNTLQTSISRLENYRKCPFSFHLTYGLKIKEKEELKIESIDTGTFMHEVIDIFFKEIDEKNINIKEIEDDEILKIVRKIVNELLGMSKYYTFTSSAKYRLLTRRLVKVVYQSICYLVYCLKYSDFTLYGHEVEFGIKGKFKTIKLEVDGKNVEITGKIDRVDTAKLSDNQYVRIIDYKSSTRDVDLNQVAAGLQIQLITYLDAICEQTNFEASGILYMGLIDNVVKDAKNMSEEKIAEKIRSNFKMKGLVLADINVIKMMDKKLQNGQSDIIPVYIDKEGNISEKKSKVISKDEFIELQNQVKQIIRDISKEILKGKIDIKPYSYQKRTGCDFCKFKTICMFNNNIKDNDYNYIRKV